MEVALINKAQSNLVALLWTGVPTPNLPFLWVMGAVV